MATERTTADLREILFTTLDGVRKNTISPEQARAIAMTVDKIIDTAKLELEYAEINAKLKKIENGVIAAPVLLTQKID